MPARAHQGIAGCAGLTRIQQRAFLSRNYLTALPEFTHPGEAKRLGKDMGSSPILPVWQGCLVRPAVNRERSHARAERFCRVRRRHAAHQARTAQREDRLRDSRQGRVHEPGRVGQGPPRAVNHRGRRAAGRTAARGHGRGGHGGQYRHRPRPYLRGARLSLRDHHSRHAVPPRKWSSCVCWEPRFAPCRLPRTKIRTITRRSLEGSQRNSTARSGRTSSTTLPTARRTTRRWGRKYSGIPPALSMRSSVPQVRVARLPEWPAS